MTSIEPHITMAPAARLAPTRTVREVLTDRVLTVAGDAFAHRLAMSVDHRHGGQVVTGVHALHVVHSLRRAHSDLVLIAEPTSHADHVATAKVPFHIPTPDGQLLPPTLEDIIRGQREAGASVVMLPTGYIEAGANDAVRAIIEAADQLEGDDILVPLYLSEGWLQAEHVTFLRGAMGRSGHAVAIAFGAETNPLASKKRLLLYRQLFQSEPDQAPRFAWRTDFAGLDAMSFGAAGTAIGVLPAQRRITPGKGKARNPKDRSPYVIMPGSVRYTKAGWMRSELFASEPAPPCLCDNCDGRSVDRFTKDDALEAHLHNLAMLQEASAEVCAAHGNDRRTVWAAHVHAAVAFHLELGRRIGRPVAPPIDVQTWAESFAGTAD